MILKYLLLIHFGLLFGPKSPESLAGEVVPQRVASRRRYLLGFMPMVFVYGMLGGSRPSLAMIWGAERGGDQCDSFIRQTIISDRSTAVDDTPSRLHATWISQGCETRSGPEYVIRKYAFFENGTFLLLRHHYAEESCSVATHTITARGVLWLVSPSILTPGATEARFQLDTVHVVPLNRQVAQKLGRRVNSTCGFQPKWRPYVPQIVYEQPHRVSNPLWEGPRYNSLSLQPSSRNRKGIDCLQPLGIEFGELRLIRVQKRPSAHKPPARPRVELILGSLSQNLQTRFTHRPIGLQPTVLLRIDTITGCPMCNAISRGTESSPPVLHEIAALPALLGGSWLSINCESVEGGLWTRRQLQVWPGDKLWTGRWDYFGDPKCSSFLYGVTAAGSYVQRAGRQRRHHLDDEETEENSGSITKREVVPWMTPELAKNIWDIYSPGRREEIDAEKMLPTFDEIREAINRDYGDSVNPEEDYNEDKKFRRSLQSDDADSYRHLLENSQPSLANSFAIMLRGNQQRYEETTPTTVTPPTPTGTTELDLHVAESILIPGDAGVSLRCGGAGKRQLNIWPRDCVPRALEAPATLGLRAKVGVTWSGEYTLLLGPREGNLWDAPLRQCGPTDSHNPELRTRLRTSVGIRFGLFSFSSAAARINFDKSVILIFAMISSFLATRTTSSF